MSRRPSEMEEIERRNHMVEARVVCGVLIGTVVVFLTHAGIGSVRIATTIGSGDPP